MTTHAHIAHPHGTFIAFRNPAFRLYMLGQVISVAGNWMQTVAQGWLVYQLTGSELWLGIVAFASGTPMLLISPFAGVIADRYAKRRVMIMALIFEMVLIFSMAILAFLDMITAWQIAVLAIGIGTALAFSEPARQAFIKELIGKETLPSGIAINAMLRNTASIVGPALAGILLATVGAGWCFLLNSLSFLAAIITLYIVQVAYPSEKLKAQAPLKTLREGLSFVRHHAVIAPILTSATIMGVLGINSVLVLMPAFASIALHSPTWAFSLMSAGLGIGSLLGSSSSVRLSHIVGRGRLILILSVLMPLSILVFSQARSIPLAVGLTSILGFGFTSFFVNANITMQIEVPDEYRGRVVSLWALQRFGLSPIVALFIGLIAQITDVVTTLVILAFLTLIFGVWIGHRAKPIRHLK